MDAGKRTVHPAVKVWVLLHAFVTFMWCIPFAAPVYKPLVNGEALPTGIERPSAMQWVFIQNDRYLHSPSSPLSQYFIWTGFWQYWDMFAPNPSNRDYYIDFLVTFADGSTKTVEYPRIANMSLPMKYPFERFRKFSERITAPNQSFTWGPIVNKIAADVYTETNHMPVRVALKQHYYDYPAYGQPIDKKYQTVVVCDLLIDGDTVKKVHGL